MHYSAIACMQMLLLVSPILIFDAVQAAIAPQCRGAGIFADAPLYYLVATPHDHAQQSKHTAQSPQQRVTPQKALEQWESKELLTVYALDLAKAQAASVQRSSWPRQERLDTEYRGESRSIAPTDFNHDGITDFFLNEDPHAGLRVSLLFLGCGDKYFTPLGFFSANWSQTTGPAVTVSQGNIAGHIWDIFTVITPDLPGGAILYGAHDASLPNMARRVIAYDPTKGVYGETLVTPLPKEHTTTKR